MTPERILNATASFLRSKVEAEGGVFALSETVARTLALLSQGPGKWRVILQYQRGAPTGNRGERVMTMLIIVQAAQTLGVQPGDAVSVADDALLKHCTQVCKWTRSMRFVNADIQQQWPQMEMGADYWLNDPNFPTRQIAHEFMVKYSQDGVTTEDVTA